MIRFVIAITFFTLSLDAFAAESAVRWQGHRLREVTSLAALPAQIRERLDVDAPGLGGVADKGQPFNVTDVVDETLPRRRFITAGQDGNFWLVVLEQGGIGYSVQVIQFVGGDVRNRSELFDTPKTLRDVVRAITHLRPDYSTE